MLASSTAVFSELVSSWIAREIGNRAGGELDWLAALTASSEVVCVSDIAALCLCKSSTMKGRGYQYKGNE